MMSMPVRPFEAVARRKLSQEIVVQIAAAIRDGRYAPGGALPSERDLMGAFGVGRPAVREALLQLEADGLIAIHHGRRAKVADPSALQFARGIEAAVRQVTNQGDRFVDDVKETRLVLEVAMARRAAEVASPESLQALMAALADNQRSISDRSRYLETDIAFHRTIAAMTGNAIFEAAAGAILGWLARFRVDCVHVEGANLLSYDEHASIARAIAARDPEAAAQAMTRHQQRSHTLYRLLGAESSGEATRSAPSADERTWPRTG